MSIVKMGSCRSARKGRSDWLLAKRVFPDKFLVKGGNSHTSKSLALATAAVVATAAAVAADKRQINNIRDTGPDTENTDHGPDMTSHVWKVKPSEFVQGKVKFVRV